MLLCETCDAGCHLSCHSPPLSAVPEDEWYCSACRASTAAAADDNGRAAPAAASDDDGDGGEKAKAPLPAFEAKVGAKCEFLFDERWYKGKLLKVSLGYQSDSQTRVCILNQRHQPASNRTI